MSLRTRLLISYAVLTALITIVTFGLLIAQLRTVPELQRQTTLLARVEDLSQFSSLVPQNDQNPGRLRDRLVRFSTQRQARVLVVADSGVVMTDSIQQQKSAMVGQTIDLSRKPRERLEAGAIGDFRDPSGRRYVFGAAPSRQGGLWLVLAQPGNERPFVVGLFDELGGALLRASLAALLLGALFAFVIARSISRPIQSVAAAARAMAVGAREVEAQVPARGPVEMRQLATDFNVMAERVREARETEREFVANVSHELRTPLTSIQGFAQAIRDGAARDPGHAADIIVDESARLQRMVNGLLDSARLEAGSVELARQPVDINAIASACAQRLAQRASDAGVSMLTTLTPESPIVRGDGDRLMQVLTNLVDNAITHTPSDGRVTITTERAAERVILAVTDTGRGIAAEDLPHVFDRFFRADKARSKTAGAGLGLAIARQIVEAHGGAIEAQSVLGVGTRMTVTLPISDASTAAQS